MALATMIKKLADAREAYESQLAEIGNDAKQAVAEYLGPVIPEGFAIAWRQYTPGFNDGEPCTFSVDTPDVFKLEKAEAHEGADEEDEQDEDDFDYDDVDGIGLTAKNYGRDHTTSGTHANDKAWSYTQEAEPVIEGLSIEAFDALAAAWADLPEDLLAKAFGDGAAIKIESGGKIVVNDYDCGY